MGLDRRAARLRADTRIAAVVLADKPKLFNQVDTMSSIFFFLNQHLPTKTRDSILLNHMRIKN